MKKNFKLYLIGWAVALVLFNLIAFVIPSLPTQDKFTSSFWIGYIFITLAFIGQLIASMLAFKSDSAKKMFYNISLVRISVVGLILSFVFGAICMILSFLPYWVGAVLCAIVLAFNIIAILKASAAIDIVSKVDEKIKVQTFFIKALAVDAETLMEKAVTDEAKAECRKVYEAIRYSDPMSSEALTSVESQITLKFNELSVAVTENNEQIAIIANELLILIGDRNKKCKLLK